MLFHLYVNVILCTRGATCYFIFMLVLYYAPEAPCVISCSIYFVKHLVKCSFTKIETRRLRGDQEIFFNIEQL